MIFFIVIGLIIGGIIIAFIDYAHKENVRSRLLEEELEERRKRDSESEQGKGAPS